MNETPVTDDFTATLPRKRMGAGALLTDERGRMLATLEARDNHTVAYGFPVS